MAYPINILCPAQYKLNSADNCTSQCGLTLQAYKISGFPIKKKGFQHTIVETLHYIFRGILFLNYLVF